MHICLTFILFNILLIFSIDSLWKKDLLKSGSVEGLECFLYRKKVENKIVFEF